MFSEPKPYQKRFKGDSCTSANLIDVNHAVELARASGLCRLGVRGQSSTSVIKRVDEDRRRGSCGGSTRDVALNTAELAMETFIKSRSLTEYPKAVAFGLLVPEHLLVRVCLGVSVLIGVLQSEEKKNL
jgi:hypothetical protein